MTFSSGMNAPRLIFGATAVVTVAALAGIFIFLIANGFQAFYQIGLKEFFFNYHWNPTSFNTPSWGIFSLLLGTLMVSFLALLLSLPLSLSIAIYLSELASPKMREILKPAVEMIASIPSVVLGLLGLLFLAPFVAKIFNIPNGLNALTAAILVAVASLPTIASICEDALTGVSYKFREASLALGATKWTTIKKIVFPAASSGIMAAVMLGFGRIIGETMIVLMVAGNSLALPNSFLDSVRPLTANIAIEIKEVLVGGLHWQALFATGLVLFLITFLINMIADILITKNSIQ